MSSIIGNRVVHLVISLGCGLTIGTSRTAGSSVSETYNSTATVSSVIGSGLTSLSVWGTSGSGIPATAWSQGSVGIAAFDFNANYGAVNGSFKVPDTVYSNVPFSITLSPTSIIPPSLPGSTYSGTESLTGPQYDGVVIQGVINGVSSPTGPSSLVATFQSVTPYDLAASLGNVKGLSYTVDPSLSNPFPIDQLILPQSMNLNLDGFTNITATIAPEPSILFFLVPLGVGLTVRHRRRNLNRGR